MRAERLGRYGAVDWVIVSGGGAAAAPDDDTTLLTAPAIAVAELPSAWVDVGLQSLFWVGQFRRRRMGIVEKVGVSITMPQRRALPYRPAFDDPVRQAAFSRFVRVHLAVNGWWQRGNRGSFG
jgi:hypothetical protein